MRFKKKDFDSYTDRERKLVMPTYRKITERKKSRLNKCCCILCYLFWEEKRKNYKIYNFKLKTDFGTF